jgi:peptidoglycan/xylan/chitin deacetylase (PgdA/CDA1 family)
MRQENVPATIFLVTGLIGGESGFWVERLIAAWRNPATQQELQAALVSRLNSEAPMRNTADSSRTPAGGGPRLPAGEGQGTEHSSFSSRSWYSAGSKPPLQNGASPDLEKLIDNLKHTASADRAQLLDGLLPADACNGCSVDRMMSWDAVVEMSEAGITFGAHTVTHPLLPYEDEATVEREIRDAKLMLEEKLQTQVRAFAYPNGDWTPAIRERVRAAGYEWAFTTRHGWYRYGRDPCTIPRVLLHEGNVTGRNGKFSPAMFTLTTVVSGS